MPPSRKEEPLAFMPSSNDAIYTPRDLDGYPSPRSSMSKHKSESDFNKHHLLSHESVVVSPLSQSRSEDLMASYIRSGSELPLYVSFSSPTSGHGTLVTEPTSEFESSVPQSFRNRCTNEHLDERL